MEKIAVTIIGAHGLTDMIIGAGDNRMWFVYAIYFVVFYMIPPVVQTFLFVVHSVLHFAVDFGYCYGLVIAVVGPMLMTGHNIDLAVRAEMCYLLFLHVPLHYHRLWPQLCASPITSCLVLGVGHFVIAVLYVLRKREKEPIWRSLTQLEKSVIGAVVCAHVSYNYCL